MDDRRAFYDQRAAARPRESQRHYHRLLQNYFSFLVPPGQSVLEVGCGLGDLLAAVNPSRGVGVDFSSKMIELARQRHPQLEFYLVDANEGGRRRDWVKRESARSFGHLYEGESQIPRMPGSGGEPNLGGNFDYILLSDLVNDLPDVQTALTNLQVLAHPRTRLVVNFFNYLWHPILNIAERAGAKAPTHAQNWLSSADMKNLLHLAGWELIKMDTRILWPIRTPLIEPLLNRWIAPLLRHFCLTVILVARPSRAAGQINLKAETKLDNAPSTETANLTSVGPEYRCTVVIPARNEAGNIEAAVQRTPEMGLGTEIIFIEGHSSDNTWEEMQRAASKYSSRPIKILRQRGQGKGTAVREAFDVATGDLLFILDADLTMPPEQLQQFYEVARSGIAEFVNGVRLVYPMENQAMPFLNLVMNKIFGLTFTWLLGQSIKDTLCGTKVLFRADYEAISRNRSYFGDFDPFGDFDLLFGAAKLNLKIIDLPIRYRARSYGETNIKRWRHGWLLCRMVLFAARRLKFIR